MNLCENFQSMQKFGKRLAMGHIQQFLQPIEKSGVYNDLELIYQFLTLCWNFLAGPMKPDAVPKACTR